MTIGEAYRNASRELAEKGIPDPAQDTCLMLSHITGFSSMEIRLTKAESPLSSEQEQRLSSLLLSRAPPTSSSSAFPPLFRSFSRSLSSRIRAISSPNPHFGALKAHIFLQKRDISGKRGVQPAVFYYDRVAKNGETLVPKPSGTSVLRVKALLEGHRLEKEK